VLKGVDGIVFVADSQAPALEPNEESLANLRQNLEELGVELRELPIVLQYNKRDLRNILPIETMNEILNPEGLPYYEAAAKHGVGVFETLKGIARLAIASVRQKVGPDAIWPKSPVAGALPAVGPDPDFLMPTLEVTPPKPLVPAEPPAPAPAAAAPPAATEDFDEDIELEFAEEDAGAQVVRAVKTRGALDIQGELEKLRAITVATPRPAPAPPPSAGRNAIERRLQDMIGTHGARQDMKRKASVEVPNGLLKGSGTMRVHLAFDGPGPEEIVRDAVIIRLGTNPKLERLTLHIDLEVKAKPPENG
jgi:hypothetical protein